MWWQPEGCCCPSVHPAAVGQLLDIVNHAVKVPLSVDLGMPAQVEATQALVVADVGKHGLDGGDALAIKSATLRGVDRLAHEMAGIVGVDLARVKQRD